MIYLSATGGFGDAVFNVGKTLSRHAPFDPNEEISITHFTNKRGAGIQDVSLDEFYELHGIHATVVLSERGTKDYLDYEKFDYYLGSGWGTEGGAWEMKPFFQPMAFCKQDTDVIISPVAAWDNSRMLSKGQLIDIVDSIPEDRKITYIGRAPKSYTRFVDSLRGESWLNRGGVKQLVDHICSAKDIIAHTGFVAYFGGAAGKRVHAIGNHPANYREAYHPKWNVTCHNDSKVSL